MKQTIIRIFCLLAVALSHGCSGSNSSIIDTGIVERVISQPSSESMIAYAKQAIDSVAMLPIDTLSESSLRRVPSLVRGICVALKEKGRIEAAVEIAAYPYGVDAQQNKQIAMRLLTSTLLPGTIAPEIQGLAPAKNRPRYTIALFHERACRTCQSIVWELKERYPELQKARVRIVSISTDTDKRSWEEYAASLPWSDKLCDYRGFQSPVMEKYGVAATPTIYLIDSKGRVVDQYMTIEEIAGIVLPTK